MTDEPAAIAGQIVRIANVGVHKSVKLEIHMPVEHATKIIEYFGWPTMANPVPVVVARLNPDVAE